MKVYNGMLVVHPHLTCPRCQSRNLHIQATTKKSRDGKRYTLRYALCYDCNLRFKTLDADDLQALLQKRLETQR